MSHLAREAFGPAVRLLASPHAEGCGESDWLSSPDRRDRVLAELRPVRRLLDC